MSSVAQDLRQHVVTIFRSKPPGTTVRSMAEDLGLAPATVHAAIHRPWRTSWDTFYAVMRRLGVTPDDLVALRGRWDAARQEVKTSPVDPTTTAFLVVAGSTGNVRVVSVHVGDRVLAEKRAADAAGIVIAAPIIADYRTA